MGYLDAMAAPTRMSVARELSTQGLRKTLIAVRSAGRYAVSRIRGIGEQVDIESLGSFESPAAPAIGRVGIPDPQLGVSWQDTLTFYGHWFDQLGETDAGYHLRRNISGLSRSRLLEQIQRDDQYALVGSYYSVFQTIMDVKRRVPLVLLNDTYLELTSFPVILPKIADEPLAERLRNVLHVMLKADDTVPPRPRDGPAADGIVVEEGDDPA